MIHLFHCINLLSLYSEHCLLRSNARGRWIKKETWHVSRWGLLVNHLLMLWCRDGTYSKNKKITNWVERVELGLAATHLPRNHPQVMCRQCQYSETSARPWALDRLNGRSSRWEGRSHG